MTRLAGLIGYPVKHSVSAAFQQAAFDHLRIDARYMVWEVAPEKLPSQLQELRRPDRMGANVTIPHKEAVIPLLDQVEELATHIGAVNTIVNRDGRLVGYNTDAQGFLLALSHEGALDPRGRRALLLGAGGAARAVAFVLQQNGIDSLDIVNRDLQRARAIAEALVQGKANRQPAKIAVHPWDAAGIALLLRGCDLIVNCTPLGTRSSKWEGRSPLAADAIPPGCLVYDLVYNPADTPLLAQARKAGARTLPGLPMLVYQGAASFQLWTGQEAPINIMMSAARKALGLSAER